MDTDEWALIMSVLSLVFTAIGTYIAYKGYMLTRRSKPKTNNCKHRKSNRQSLTKITVAFSIKVTRK